MGANPHVRVEPINRLKTHVSYFTGAFSQVSAGSWHTPAVGSDGTEHCWGLNDDGQCNPPGFIFSQVWLPLVMKGTILGFP